MSLMSMRRKMASKLTATILWVIIIVFLVGVVLWSVPRNPSTNATQSEYRPGGNKVLASVNGEKIYADDLDKAFDDILTKNDISPNLDITLNERGRIFTSIIERILTKQILRGFKLSDGKLKEEARKVGEEYASFAVERMRQMAGQQEEYLKAMAKTEDEKKSVKTSDEYFIENIRMFYMQDAKVPVPANPNEKDFRKFFVNQFLMEPKYGNTEEFMKRVRLTVIGRKLVAGLPVNPFTDEYAKKVSTQHVKARWIFVEAEKLTPEAIDAARVKAEKLREDIVKDPASFAKVAEKESNHISSTLGGELGWISGGDTSHGLPAIVEYLIFSQKPTELGPVTQINVQPYMTSMMAAKVGYGFVQAIQVKERTDLEKGFNWETKRTTALDDLKTRYESALGQGYLTLMLAKADVKCESLEVAAYLAMARNQSTDATELMRQALAKEEKELPSYVIGAMSYQVAQATPDSAARIPLLDAALKYADDKAWELHKELGDAYARTKQTEQAIKQYEYAINASSGENEMQVRQDIRGKYKELGHMEGVKAIDEWIAKQESNK